MARNLSMMSLRGPNNDRNLANRGIDTTDGKSLSDNDDILPRIHTYHPSLQLVLDT